MWVESNALDKVSTHHSLHNSRAFSAYRTACYTRKSVTPTKSVTLTKKNAPYDAFSTLAPFTIRPSGARKASQTRNLGYRAYAMSLAIVKISLKVGEARN